MKKSTQVTLVIVSLVAFIALMGAVSLAYNFLSESFKAENLLELDTSTEQPKPTQTTLPTLEPDPTQAPADPQNIVPDFSATDIEGNEVNLSDYFGKPIVLNFWASWCSPCKMEMPHFQEVYEERGDEITFLMVNLTDGNSETVDSASSYIQSQGYTFPLLFDTFSDGATTYAVQSIPTTYFIDAQGQGVAVANGAISKQDLLKGIEMSEE